MDLRLGSWLGDWLREWVWTRTIRLITLLERERERERESQGGEVGRMEGKQKEKLDLERYACIHVCLTSLHIMVPPHSVYTTWLR